MPQPRKPTPHGSQRRPRPPASSSSRRQAGGGSVKTWVRANGDRGFAIRFRDQHGEDRHLHCGLTSQGWTPELAELALEEHLERVRRRTFVPPPELVDDGDADPLFSSFAAEVLADHEVEVDEGTADFNSNMLRNHLDPFFGQLRLSQITYEKIKEFKRERVRLMKQIRQAARSGVAIIGNDGRRMRLSERTINHSLSVLGFVLEEAVLRESIMLSTNAVRHRGLHVKVPKKTVRDWLEGDEVVLLLEAAERVDNPVRPSTLRRAAEVRRLRDECGLTIKETAARLRIAKSTVWLLYTTRPLAVVSQTRVIVALLSDSGARNTEVCELRPVDLDFGHDQIRIPDSKTEKGVREIDMTPWLREQLWAYVRSLGPDYPRTAPLFVNKRGNAYNKDTLNGLLKRVFDEAMELCAERGLAPLPTRLTAHVFRRTYITHMFEAGAPPRYVQDQVGHEDARLSLTIYARVLSRRDRHKHGAAFDEMMRGAVPRAALQDDAVNAEREGEDGTLRAA